MRENYILLIAIVILVAALAYSAGHPRIEEVTFTQTVTKTQPITTTVTSTITTTNTMTETLTKTTTRTQTKTLTKTATYTTTTTQQPSLSEFFLDGPNEVYVLNPGSLAIPSMFGFSDMFEYGYAVLEFEASAPVKAYIGLNYPDGRGFTIESNVTGVDRLVIPIMPGTQLAYGFFNPHDTETAIVYNLTLYTIYIES